MLIAGQKIHLTFAVMFLIGMNLIPVFGVFVFGWDVGVILLLYWLETVIVGILNVPKMLSCQGLEQSTQRKVGLFGKVFLCVFFGVHFGAFCFGHYTFLDSFFKTIPPLSSLVAELLSAQGLLFAMIGLILSHLISMAIYFYGKGEFKTRSPNAQMFVPYGRVVLMHIVIIIGGALVAAFGAPVLALILLVLLKIGIDIFAHAVEHQGLKLNIETGNA